MLAYRFLIVGVLVACAGPASAADRNHTSPKLRVLRGGDHGVGRLAPNLKIRDLSSRAKNLRQLASENQAVVIAMTSTSCPLSEKYFPRLLSLADEYAKQKVQFVLVNSVTTDKMPAMDRAKRRLGENGIYVFDKSGALANAMGAETTTDAILIDRDGTIVYHGAVDDQHRFGFSHPAPRHHFLVDAIEALLADEDPGIEATTAPGSSLERNESPTAKNDATYHNRISRLMNRHCVKCHRNDGVGPFGLDTYGDVASHAPMIGEVVERGTMPPWFAASDDPSKASPWANDASMTPKEKQDLLGWVNGSQQEGNATDAPEPLDFDRDWQIGEPDVVYEFPRAIPVRATGVMPYKYVEIETRLNRDRWVEAVEVVPGQPSVVHHVLVFAVPQNQPARNQINYWAGYVPGNGARAYPPSHARFLPRGARLVFQVHYTPNGTATRDKTKIGIRFADDPPEFEVKTGSVVNRRFSIPAGATNHRVEASMRVPVKAAIIGFMPHHHLRGVAGRYELVGQNQRTRTLLDVPDYDFNWQLFYQYAQPTVFRQGSIIRYTAWYDNSAGNPANPDPNITVRWGPQTADEMHVGYIEFAVPTGL
jgi:thiol-disulfide isomerase/thioredoxin